MLFDTNFFMFFIFGTVIPFSSNFVMMANPTFAYNLPFTDFFIASKAYLYAGNFDGSFPNIFVSVKSSVTT